jgi:hypothetical protein
MLLSNPEPLKPQLFIQMVLKGPSPPTLKPKI